MTNSIIKALHWHAKTVIFRIHPRRKKSKFWRSGVPVSRGITCALELELHRRFSPKVAIFLCWPSEVHNVCTQEFVRLMNLWDHLPTNLYPPGYEVLEPLYLSLSLTDRRPKPFWVNWILVHRRLFEVVVAVHDHQLSLDTNQDIFNFAVVRRRGRWS